MNKPIKTETRGKRHHRGNGSDVQDELREVLSGAQGTPAREPILSARTNLDMGDGSILTSAKTIEEARERPTISLDELAALSLKPAAEQHEPQRPSFSLNDPALVSQESALSSQETAMVSKETAMASSELAVTSAATAQTLNHREATTAPGSAEEAAQIERLLTNMTPAEGAELREQFAEIDGELRGMTTGEALLKNELLTNLGGVTLDNIMSLNVQVDALLTAGRTTLKKIPSDDKRQMREFIDAFCGQLEALAPKFPLPEVEASEDDPYYARNIKVFITRFPKNQTEDGKQKLTDMLSKYPARLGGFYSGFEFVPQGSKMVMHRTKSRPELYYQERRNKRFSRWFQELADRIATHGLNDATTFDFLAVEFDESDTLVIDAWECKNMYPSMLGQIESTIVDDRTGFEEWSVQVFLGGEVNRNSELVAEVKHWLTLNQNR